MKLEELSRQEMIDLWINQGKTDREIAAMCFTTTRAVKARRQELGVFLGCNRNLSLSELIALRHAIDLEIEKQIRREKQEKQDD